MVQTLDLPLKMRKQEIQKNHASKLFSASLCLCAPLSQLTNEDILNTMYDFTRIMAAYCKYGQSAVETCIKIFTTAVASPADHIFTLVFINFFLPRFFFISQSLLLVHSKQMVLDKGHPFILQSSSGLFCLCHKTHTYFI